MHLPCNALFVRKSRLGAALGFFANFSALDLLRGTGCDTVVLARQGLPCQQDPGPVEHSGTSGPVDPIAQPAYLDPMVQPHAGRHLELLGLRHRRPS